MTDDGFYDDSGRYWPKDAEWCDRCQGMGIANCYCGGDQCYCENYGEMECPRCDGEGYFVPTEAFKAARRESARWWAELHNPVPASAMSAGTAETAQQAQGDSPPARPEGDAQTPVPNPLPIHKESSK